MKANALIKIVILFISILLIFNSVILAQSNDSLTTSFYISGALFSSFHNFFNLANFGYKDSFLVINVMFQQFLISEKNFISSFTLVPTILYPVPHPLIGNQDVVILDFSYYDFSLLLLLQDISMHIAFNFSESDLSTYFVQNYYSEIFDNKAIGAHTFLFIPSFNTKYPIYYHGILPFFLYSPSLVLNAQVNPFLISYRLASLEPYTLGMPPIKKPLHYIRFTYNIDNTFLLSLHGASTKFEVFAIASDVLIKTEFLTIYLYTFTNTSSFLSTINVGGSASYNSKISDAIDLSIGGFFDFYTTLDQGFFMFLEQFEFRYIGFSLKRTSTPVKNAGGFAQLSYKDNSFNLMLCAYPYYSLEFSKFFIDAMLHMQLSVFYMTLGYEDDFYRVYRSGIKLECGIQYSF